MKCPTNMTVAEHIYNIYNICKITSNIDNKLNNNLGWLKLFAKYLTALEV